MPRSTITKPEEKLVAAAIKKALEGLDTTAPGFRASIVVEISKVFKKLRIKENPPPRSSVDRWLGGHTTPTLPRFLILEQALKNMKSTEEPKPQ